jgi:ubiquinol-cytochrome c reductase cytochrome b subunit
MRRRGGSANDRPTSRPSSAADAAGARIEDPKAAASGTSTELERMFRWLDTRTGAADPIRLLLRKVFPDHWTFLLGEVALFTFVVLVATGTFLTLFFVPDAREQVYNGPYVPLQGTSVSAAFASVMRLSFEVRAGLLMRQIHHWAALIFVAAIAAHLMRVFFTAAFRRPRELNWLIGVVLLLLALAEGLTGYSLPDDLLSGTGIRIFYSAVLSIPFLGPWFAFLIFGGEFPTPDILGRFFVFHIMLIPALLIGLIAIHVGLVFLQKHSQYRGGRARESNVIGLPFWPQQAFRSLGLQILTAAVIVLIAAFVEINPIWIYGPFVPYTAAAPAQPDWYLGWLEGLLRMGPSFEPTILGVTIPEPFLPGIVAPMIVIVPMFVWPWIEARLTHDHREHHLLDRWWDNPYRTATGAAFIALFLVTTFAGGNDVLAAFFNIPVESLTVLFIWSMPTVPVATWLIVWYVARQRRRRGDPTDEPAGGTRVVRNAMGGFDEVAS